MLLGLLCLVSGAAATADAQHSAAAHFDRGVTLSAQGDYAASLREFEEAYRIAPAWQVLFNLGVVREKLGEPVLALKAFEQYLAEGAREIPGARRRQVARELEGLRKQVGELVVEASGVQKLEVDGVEMPVAAHLYVSPGRHRIVAAFDGTTAHADVDVHRGERQVLALAPSTPAPVASDVPAAAPAPAVTLAPVAVSEPAPAPPAPAPAATVTSGSNSHWYGHWYVWVAAVVVAGAAAGSIAYVETRPSVDVHVNVP